MRSPLRPVTCLLLPFLVAVHERVPLSSGCSSMLGISLICCAVLAEHASSNASDSESSYRKLLLWFVAFFSFAIAPPPPLPVVVISDFCCCCFHLHPKQMAWNEIILWCGKIQKTLGPRWTRVINASSSNPSGLAYEAILPEKVGGQFDLVDFDGSAPIPNPQII